VLLLLLLLLLLVWRRCERFRCQAWHNRPSAQRRRSSPCARPGARLCRRLRRRRCRRCGHREGL
jgi:hypothetical protein